MSLELAFFNSGKVINVNDELAAHMMLVAHKDQDEMVYVQSFNRHVFGTANEVTRNLGMSCMQ